MKTKAEKFVTIFLFIITSVVFLIAGDTTTILTSGSGKSYNYNQNIGNEPPSLNTCSTPAPTPIRELPILFTVALGIWFWWPVAAHTLETVFPDKFLKVSKKTR